MEYKEIQGTKYKINEKGMILSPKGKVLSINFNKGCWKVSLVINGKSTLRSVAKLVMETFKPDDKIPFIKDRGTFKKSGRPSRKLIKHADYNIGYSNHIEFIDGNVNNLHISNLKYKLKTPKRYGAHKPKYANVFYTGSALISQIQQNTNESNKVDNDIIIRFLNGDDACLWGLLSKYDNNYMIALKMELKKLATKSKKKRKESSTELYDIIIEGKMKIIGKIKKGRFDGKNFKSWSCKVIVNYLHRFFDIQKQKDLKDKTEVFFD